MDYRLLFELGDALGAYYHARREVLLKYLDVRNHSLLAHGLAPVDEAQWRKVGEPWRQWVLGALADARVRRSG
jgi:hypothetical protein